MTTALASSFFRIFRISNLNQSQFFAKHSNQSVRFIRSRQCYFHVCQSGEIWNERVFFPCILIFSLYKTNRFHVAVCLFSNRSQRTSKCGKNIRTFLFLLHFDVICDLLLNRRTATWNLFVKYFSINNSCVNTIRLHFPWSILYI